MSEIEQIQGEINQLNQKLINIRNQEQTLTQEIIKKMGVLEYLQKKERVE